MALFIFLTFLSHHTVVWLGYRLTVFVRLRISQQRKKDSDVKRRVLLRLLFGKRFSHFELWFMGGSPRSLNTSRGGRFLGLRRAKLANKSRIAEKTVARSAIYQTRHIFRLPTSFLTMGVLAVWWDMRLADALVYFHVFYFKKRWKNGIRML